MAKKIATAVAVFHACDELDTQDHAWNRDDVRLRVGGGGFNVIDPLIQAWRRLQPIKAIAPNTPTELLHQVAQSLEQHLGDFMEQASKNAQAREALFEQTTTELSETLESLNDQVAEWSTLHQGLEAQREALSQKNTTLMAEIQEYQRSQQQQQTENDHLRGQIQRLEAEAQARLAEHEQALQTLAQDYQTTLKAEKIEWRQAQELAEDRLLRLLDKERQEAKKQTESFTQTIHGLKEQISERREKLAVYQTRIAQKDEQVTQLQTEHEHTAATLTDLQAAHQTLRVDHESLLNENRQQDQLAQQIESAMTTLQAQLTKSTEA